MAVVFVACVVVVALELEEPEDPVVAAALSPVVAAADPPDEAATFPVLVMVEEWSFVFVADSAVDVELLSSLF